MGIKEVNELYEAWEFYAKVYNGLTEEERNTPSIGGKTRGEYLKENYIIMRKRWEKVIKDMIAK